jgi:hypothetical protein
MVGDFASIQVVIPVRDEAATITTVVENLRGQGLRRIRVVDNGSSDGSGELAHGAGAVVLREPSRGMAVPAGGVAGISTKTLIGSSFVTETAAMPSNQPLAG